MTPTIDKRIWIVDSGSTKCDWQLYINGQLAAEYKTKGINPYYQTKEEIIELLYTHLPKHEMAQAADAMYYYGAGITDKDQSEFVRSILVNFVNAKEIIVESDLLGAARAMCGHQEGIVCIMGTGSNSCHYDGTNIVANTPPLGFILGDEGSAGNMGKYFVTDLLRGELSSEISNAFYTEYKLTPKEIMQRIYRAPFPNRFLASLAPFIIRHHKEDEELAWIVRDSIEDFLDRCIVNHYPHRQFPVHFIGSIAVVLQEIIAEIANQFNIAIGEFKTSPLPGLAYYHHATK